MIYLILFLCTVLVGGFIAESCEEDSGGRHRKGKPVTDFEEVAKRLYYKHKGEYTYKLYTGGHARHA